MSITSNFPAIKPTLLLDFANTKQLDPRITFTRASTATYYGTQTAKAEENLLTYSQELDNADWTKTNSTITANATAAPDGTTTAEKIISNASVTDARASQSKTVSGSVVFSVFAKASEWGLVLLGPVGTTVGVYFNLSTGAVGTQSAGYVGTITSVGSGWYRCSVAYTGSGTNQTVRIYPTNADGSISTGDGTSGIFLWGAQLEQRSAVTAYTPTTTQPITNYIPQLLTAASGVARFDHNPTTFESLGLEIEESRTNLMTYSEQFDDASWTKANSTITANTIVAPDGALTCDKLVADATNNFHTVFRAFSFTSGTAYTLSIFAKAGEYQYLSLTAGNTGTFPARVTFDLISGTVSSTVSGTGSIQSVGNGWYRCSVSATATATASTGVNFAASSTGSYVTYTGDGYSGIYIWGAQLEAGAFATSYIPTVASQVTRAADAASMTGTNFSSWYNVGQGTLYAEANTPSFATTYVFADINNNSTTTYIRQSTASTGTNTQFVISDNSVTTASPGVIVTLGSYRRIAGAYTADSVQQSVNGSLGTEDTSATIPSGLSQMNIGTRSSGANTVNGTIKKIAYYPLRVTNAQLQAMTTV